jgi:GT2 family glycosyltransferase
MPAETIVVDQSDRSNAILQTRQMRGSNPVRYIRMNSIGLARARNEGVRAASYDVLAFIDDDMYVAHHWLESLIGALAQSGENSVVTGQVRSGNAETPGGFAPSTKTDHAREIYEGRPSRDVLWAGNMAMWRSAVVSVGKFDERLGAGSRFPSSEDNDYGFRLLEAGFRILYVPEALVYHRAWRSDRDYLRLRWSYGRGQGAYYAKYLSIHDPYMMRRMARELKSTARRFVTQVARDRRAAWSHAVYLIALLSGAAEWLFTESRRESC